MDGFPSLWTENSEIYDLISVRTDGKWHLPFVMDSWGLHLWLSINGFRRWHHVWLTYCAHCTRDTVFLVSSVKFISLLLYIVNKMYCTFLSWYWHLVFFMATLRSRCGHYIFVLWLLSSFFLSFFPRLISAAAEWMSTILLHSVALRI